MRRAAPALALVLLALAGCSSGVTREQAEQVCAGLTAGAIVGTGGVAFTHAELQKKYDMSAPEASEAMRQAVKDYCPEYQRLMS